MNNLPPRFPLLHLASGRQARRRLAMAPIWSTSSDATRDVFPRLPTFTMTFSRQWLDAKRAEATDKLYQALLKGYTIRIEPPEEKKVAQVR